MENESEHELDDNNHGDSDSPDSRGFPTPDFSGFISGLYTQSLMAMGEIGNNDKNQSKVDLNECQFLIDTIAMIEKKTEGNLTGEESKHLKSILSDLRMRYVKVVRENSSQS